MSATVSFRNKQYQIPFVAARERLRSATEVPIWKRFLLLICYDSELTLKQLEEHAIFVSQTENGGSFFLNEQTNYSDWLRPNISLHLCRVCCVCQIDDDNDIDSVGAEFDGPVFMLFCGHTLHRACFEQMQNKNCPLCRNAALQQLREQETVEQRAHQQVSEATSSTSSSFLAPKWSRDDNARLSARYRLSEDCLTASVSDTEHGMLILHSEPLTGNNRYCFAVSFNRECYMSAALLLEKQPENRRNFGRDFQICKPLYDNLNRQQVIFQVDMRARTAQYKFGADESAVVRLVGLPETVWLACVLKGNDSAPQPTATIRPLQSF